MDVRAMPKTLAAGLAVLAGAAVFGVKALHSSAPPEPKQIAGPGLPYAFSFPGDWRQDDYAELPAGARSSLAHPTAVSKGDTGGVLVGAFPPASPVQVASAVRVQYERYGGRVRSQRDIRIGGLEALELEADADGGRVHDRTTIVFVGPRLAYWVQCIGIGEGKEDADDACDQVLESFRITNPGVDPGGPPRAPAIGTPA